MNLNDNNIKNKNLLSVKENSTSELKNLAKIISPNVEKNINDINANKNIISNFNSNSNGLTSNKKNNKKNSQMPINSELINIDNIDVSSYNPDPFVLPNS